MADPMTDAEIAALIGRGIAAAGVAREAYNQGKSIYRGARSSFRTAQRGAKKAMSWGSRIRRDIRSGLARGGTIERRLGLRSRQNKSRAAAIGRSRAGTSYFNKKTGNISGARRAVKSRFITRKPQAKYVKRTYDDTGTMTRNRCTYIVQQDHGSTVRFFDMIAAAIAKAALGKLHIYPESYDTVIVTPTDSINMQLAYRRTRGPDPAYEDMTTAATANGATFGDFVDVISGQLKVQADAGWIPYEFSFYGTTGQGNVHYQQLAESIIEVQVFTNTLIQNVTENDSSGLDTAQADRNPIRGKIYKCSNKFPRVRDGLLKAHQALVGFHEDHNDGLHNAVTVGVDSSLGHPPRGKTLFANCKGERNAFISAGGVLHDKAFFKVKTTIKKLFERIILNGSAEPVREFGTSTCFAFEQALRTTADAPVSVSVNRTVVMRSYLSCRTKVPMLHNYIHRTTALS